MMLYVCFCILLWRANGSVRLLFTIVSATVLTLMVCLCAIRSNFIMLPRSTIFAFLTNSQERIHGGEYV